MPPKIRTYLHDILVAADSIDDYIGTERNFTDYLNNK